MGLPTGNKRTIISMLKELVDSVEGAENCELEWSIDHQTTKIPTRVYYKTVYTGKTTVNLKLSLYKQPEEE